MTTYFITGIDTDVGKTVATGLLARHLADNGKSVITQKLIQTGVSGGIADDIISHRRLMGLPILDIDTDGTTCPIVLTKPASPHLAARLENRTVDLSLIDKSTDELAATFDIVLLEGAGGALVPITEDLLTLDFIKERNYPVIVVTSARLGSISHTLLTLEAIKTRNMTLFGVVFNHHFDDDIDISQDTLRFLKNHLAVNYPSALFLRLMDGQILNGDGEKQNFADEF